MLLVDASQSANNLTQQMNLGKERGLRDLLFNPGNPPLLQDCVVQVSSLPFHVLPNGRPIRTLEHLTAERLSPLLDQLGSQYRFVVIDGDAVYSAADTWSSALRSTAWCLSYAPKTPAGKSPGPLCNA